MLDRAKMLLLEVLDVLETEIEQEVPVVVLEPSCATVFRDELLDLFPYDQRAKALSRQTFVLSEFLEQRAPHFSLPKFPRQALMHGHCHHKSIVKMSDEEAVLRRMEIDFQSPAPGCCGMAGSFGFESEKYEMSVAIGELELLPAVRKAAPDCLIIADGFSCREQIAQCTDRHALHLAEVIQMALHPEWPEAEFACPEQARVLRRQAAVRSSMTRTGLGVAGIATGALALWLFGRRHRAH
jgi:Fe-S oxidoreductase